MYNEFICGDLELPLQGALYVNTLYPGLCRPRIMNFELRITNCSRLKPAIVN